MNARLWLLVGIALLVVWVVLEGKRQERVHGKSRRRGLMRAGLLELQKQLEPERKVEILVEERDDTVEDDAAAPPLPGAEAVKPAAVRGAPAGGPEPQGTDADQDARVPPSKSSAKTY